MGMGPIYRGREHPAVTARNQEQATNQQLFDQSAYMPIPGYRGSQNPQGPLGAPTSQQPDAMQSQWNSLNGRLLGDTYLPPDVNTTDIGKGWYEVNHGGQRVGTLRPGGPNGRFLNDTNWQMPQPGLVGATPGAPVGPPAGQPAGPMPQPFSASGPYGAQAMQMAGLLSQPPPADAGLLGGPKRGFRIPGGK